MSQGAPCLTYCLLQTPLCHVRVGGIHTATPYLPLPDHLQSPDNLAQYTATVMVTE